MTPRQPSLLVFTLDPAHDCARRRLLPARFEGLERTLRQRSLETALEAGLAGGFRLEVSSPEALDLGSAGARAQVVEQRGAGFGERFRHALRDCHERSSGPLVVVGSDVPGLTPRHLEAALERLAEHPDRVVLGPSPDGGFYLLATNRPLDAVLAEVEWCRRETRRSLIAALRARGLEVTLIAPLADLDRPQDLLAWLARDAAAAPALSGLRQLLRQLLADLCRPLRPSAVGSARAGLALSTASRGPPLQAP